ncbi:MAG: Tad domain-containing protein [Chloroflexota bacterium]
MKKPSIHNTKERGQAIVLVAITMVIMLAFTGLAIDGGGAFLLYRDVQNATDSAALSAAFALCSEGDPVSAGLRSAAINGFEDPSNSSPNSQGAPVGSTTGTDVRVTINHPPVDGPYAGDDQFVTVEIESTKPSYFIQVVYDGPLVINARTTSQCDPGVEGVEAAPPNPLDKYAIFVGSETCGDKTIDNSGSNTEIWGGLHSNFNQDWGGNDLDVYGPVTSVGRLNNGDSSNRIYEFEERSSDPDRNRSSAQNRVAPIPMPQLYTMDDFRPNYPDPSNHGSVWQAALDAGVVAEYHSWAECGRSIDGKMVIKDTGRLNESTGQIQTGLYVSECGIEVSASASNSGITSRITFVAAGEISISGSDHTMIAWWDNLLVYSDYGYRNSGDICSKFVMKVEGSNQQFTGLFYAPNGMIEMAGSNSVFTGAFIGNTFRLNGSNHIINFDAFFSAPQPVDSEPPRFGLTE